MNTNDDSKPTALVRLDNPAELVRRDTDIAHICRDIVTATAVNIQGRKFIRCEGWLSLATAHGCIASARDVQRTESGFKCVGELRRLSDGTVLASAEGFLGDDETTWAKRPEYAKRAMCQTRAVSRVCRTAFAHVVVLMNAGLETTPAEEVPDGGFDAAPARHAAPPKKAELPVAGQDRPAPARTQPAAPQVARKATTQEYLATGDEVVQGQVVRGRIAEIKEKSGQSPKGKAWVRYGVALEGDNRVFGTFDTKHHTIIAEADANNWELELTVEQDGKYWNIVGVNVPGALDEAAAEGGAQ